MYTSEIKSLLLLFLFLTCLFTSAYLFKSALRLFGMSQVIFEPTRLTDQSDTARDVVLCSDINTLITHSEKVTL